MCCCNCGHDEYQVEVCTPTTLDAYRDFLASTPCPDCGITETVSVVRIYEGRRPAASVHGGASLFTP